ncbi:glycosyltransferase family 39 protein [Hymenobacter sp. RP-2-7]|uniref:Glycosyltransferase family 39 protein n=1 Tax=Hymenobacter polaris TaxID=2682546 RepID=A0A7Y0AGN3_9BACT|nr:glycosyltransferase family 39 protein [Hymenobacter polaris]NML67011.1 glycosyltransferase family 39 protein [Hymenobacter polaris]
MKSRLIFWLAAAVLVLAQFQDHRWKVQEVFDWDGGGYYGYLPDYFLYGGPGRADSLNQLLLASRPGQPHPMGRMGMHRLPNGKVLIKYPLGVALGQLPWFAGAHLYARWHGDPPNGYSRPYQQAVMVAGLVYAIIGLWVLRKLLRRYFPDHVVAWTLGAIALGTNLLGYATYEAAISHAALFMWQAALLYCTARWYESPRRRWAAGMGLFLGLAVLCRHSEAVYALIPLTWGLGAGRRPAVLGRYLDQLLMAGGVAAAVLSLQFFHWHAVSGHWVADGYQGEFFDFRHPHIIEGLFSFRKGWLLYTPLMAPALLGTGWLRRWVPGALAPVLVLLPVLLWVTFSWQQWWYGGGFSARPLISVYPLLALPLAALLASAATRGGLVWVVLRTLLVAGIVLNLWQTWQWNGGIIESENETRALYFQRFFWRKFPEAPRRW